MYTGFFEAHITLKNTNQNIEDFKEFCNENKAKPIFIELERGDVQKQLMTSSLHNGNFNEIKKEVEQLAAKMKQKNYEVSRVKIEAHPENTGIPMTKSDILKSQLENYFEAHYKIILPVFSQAKENLLSLVEKHAAHLSKNAFKKRKNHSEERFVTKRMYNVGKTEAYQSFEELHKTLKENNYQIDKKIVEYCVFDSNVSVDNNWLTLEEPCYACEAECKMNFNFPQRHL
ncbi:hypothetical protein [Bernardetia sp.]|uniref:hypothetical protein n=1 Tax=Bernardetia sp. TaxID=1937974 RepID=UPI0025C51297|nr:hypothetical protein [Bernardetia sp.]